MQTESIEIEKLISDPANARRHDQKNIEAIKGSLARFGQQKPIVVAPDGVVIAGNGTLEAAKALGWKKIAAVRSNLAGSDRTAFALADNRTAELAAWDDEILTSTLRALEQDGFPIAEIGFDGFDLSLPPAEGKTDPDDVPSDVPSRTKPGDIFVLGGHRLMCGDSTDIGMVQQLMVGECADICFTSPPYNADDGKYQNNDDDLKDGEYRDFLSAFTGLALGCSRYVFVNLQMLARNRIPLIEYQYQFRGLLKDILIWNKSQCPPNIVKGAFNTKWEYVLCYSQHDFKSRGFPASFQGKYANVVETESNSGNEFAADHKAGFPVAFPIWFLERLDFVKSVYEPFAGTGTTLIACQKTGRRCFGMEIDPHYCDVIMKRWEDFTGLTANLDKGEVSGDAAPSAS